MHYLLFYEKTADHAQREPPYQEAHRSHVRAAAARGELVLGGPLSDAPSGANLLLFRANSATTVEDFANADPYVLNGIVNRWRVQPWETVVGKDAECLLPEFKLEQK